MTESDLKEICRCFILEFMALSYIRPTEEAAIKIGKNIHAYLKKESDDGLAKAIFLSMILEAISENEIETPDTPTLNELLSKIPSSNKYASLDEIVQHIFHGTFTSNTEVLEKFNKPELKLIERPPYKGYVARQPLEEEGVIYEEGDIYFSNFLGEWLVN